MSISKAKFHLHTEVVEIYTFNGHVIHNREMFNRLQRFARAFVLLEVLEEKVSNHKRDPWVYCWTSEHILDIYKHLHLVDNTCWFNDHLKEVEINKWLKDLPTEVICEKVINDYDAKVDAFIELYQTKNEDINFSCLYFGRVVSNTKSAAKTS